MAGDASARRGDRARQIRVITLLAVGTAVVAFGVYQVGRIFDVFASRYPLITVVPTVAGLREGAPVTLAGQRVGQVERIRFLPLQQQSPDRHVSLRLAVNRDVQSQVRRDSKAYIKSQGLLGDKYVDIVPGTPASAVLLPGDTLPAAEAVDLESVLQLASGTMHDARDIIGDLRGITSAMAQGEGTLGRMLNDDALYLQMTSATGELADVLKDVNDPRGSLGRLMRDPVLYDRAAGAIARVDTLTSLALHSDGTLGKLLNSDEFYDRAVGSMTTLDSTLAGVNSLLEQFDGSHGTLQQLINDPTLYDQLLKAVVDMQTLIQDVRQNPGKYKPNIKVDVF